MRPDWGRLMTQGPRHPTDRQIVAIALLHGFPVVTRNTPDFGRTGVQFLDPFIDHRVTSFASSLIRSFICRVVAGSIVAGQDNEPSPLALSDMNAACIAATNVSACNTIVCASDNST